MSQKKITIKDVAREAGVSVATVSYVINNRTDIRITEATRKKVLQVINLLNYTPNQAAKALATNRKSLLALSLCGSTSPLKHAEQMYIIEFLSEFFHSKNYELLILNTHYNEKCDQADAIVCFDISSEYFHRLGDCNFIPLVALDCFINDPLFFQVNSSPKRLKEEAAAYFGDSSYRYLTLSTDNKEKEQLLLENFKDIRFVWDFHDITGISGANLLITDQVLYELLRENNHVCYSPSLSVKKAEQLFACIEKAIDRTPMEQHDLFV